MMMVCEHKAHSWSVSCPSFFFFLLLLSTLPASSLHLYTYSLPPPVAHSYSHLFFYSHRRARKLPGEAQKRACFFLSFLSSFSSLSLALFLSLPPFALLCDLMVEYDVEQVYYYRFSE
jgi:hypothetical protein